MEDYFVYESRGIRIHHGVEARHQTGMMAGVLRAHTFKGKNEADKVN